MTGRGEVISLAARNPGPVAAQRELFRELRELFFRCGARNSASRVTQRNCREIREGEGSPLSLMMLGKDDERNRT